MVPDVGSRPASININVVLPEPLAPVTAMCSPAWTARLISRSASRSAPGYRNDTLSSRTGTGPTGALPAPSETSNLCTSGILRIRSRRRDSADQLMNETMTTNKTMYGKISSCQWCIPLATYRFKASPTPGRCTQFRNAATPLALAVMTSKNSCRSRVSTARTATHPAAPQDSGDQRQEGDRRRAPALALDDSAQSADPGAVDEHEQAAQSGDQRRSPRRLRSRPSGRGAVAVGQQSHGHGAQHAQPLREWDYRGEDLDRRAEGPMTAACANSFGRRAPSPGCRIRSKVTWAILPVPRGVR